MFKMPPESQVDVSRYLREVGRKWMKDNAADQKTLAERVGVSPAHVTGLLSPNGGGAGTKTKRGFAKLLGVKLWELERDAAAWNEANPSDEPATVETRPVVPDPYPNRALALQAARIMKLNAEAIQYVADLPGFKSYQDPDPEWWLRRIQLEADRLVGTVAARAGVVVTPDMLPKPRRRG